MWKQFLGTIYVSGRATALMAMRRQRFTRTDTHAQPVRLCKQKNKEQSISADGERT